jgi:GT2 family glycosyltransferase
MTRSRRVVERGYGMPDGPATAAEGYVFSACGAALLVRRETVEDISVAGQLFDESYFAFSEDLDIGWRARLAGWRAWYAPRAVAYHYRGGTEAGGEGSRRLAPALLRRPRALRFHILKNRWLTMLKNDAAGSFARDLPFIALRDAAIFAAAVATSPGLIADFAHTGPLWRAARAKRREFLSGEGRWGRRRAGAPGAWVRWNAPLPEEPERR